jgi:outer membrane lipoprotein SlyB
MMMIRSSVKSMNRQAIAAVAAVFALALSAGCSTLAPEQYHYGEAREMQSVAYGTVESVRPVKLDEDHAPVGTVAGALLGGVLGNEIGHGLGRAAATLAGAVAGGVGGNAVEHRLTAQKGDELVVRLDDGRTVAVTQGESADFERGQRVRVVSGAEGSRVEHL